MFELFMACVLLVGAAGAGLYFYFRQQKRRELISLLTHKADLLAHWTYTPAEWRKAVEEEFTWASSKDYAGEVFISPTGLYVKADHCDHLIDLAERGKVVTHASYSGTDNVPLKLRVRWRVDRQNRNGVNETKYYKKDYRIPVPSGAVEAGRKVADFFTRQLENNLEAYTAVLGDDDTISLFGKDSF